ncbi:MULTISPECIES: alkaline phosphatase family protein [unclassified Paraburkholderia]|uniref:alkaline phosphatase family protein n=1 Tax=unclassified Paraburkholderia TaxID=2615204 RepID=UPI002AB2DCFC|nr:MULTISPECIES: alkaline phosphatase family protein [unclassified Paraburkholderia]
MNALRSRLVWLVIDGLSWQLVEQLADRRPHSILTRALRDRRAIRLMPLIPNCQTPPSLFSIFSGTDVTRHGLTGYLVPTPSNDTPFGFADGFSQWPRNIQMVWDRLAAAGYRLRLCAAPFVQQERLGIALVGRTNVYGGFAVAPEAMVDGERLTIPALDIDMRVEAVGGGFALHDLRNPDESPSFVSMDGTLALPLAPNVPYGNAYRAIALHAMRIDGVPTLISLGYRAVDVVGPPAPLAAFPACDPARLYANGQLGRRLDDGGDGAAEHALVSLMRIVHDSFKTDIVAAVRATDSDCVIGYDPVIDLLSHHLLKYVDPRQPASPAARVVEALFDTALGWIDTLLDECLTASPEPFRCIAHSDHGMAPVHHDLFPNAFLEQAGLLAYDEFGNPDPLRSAALFHPAENGLVMLHPVNLGAKGFDHETLAQAWRAALPDSMRGGWNHFIGFGTTPLDMPSVAGWRAQCYWQAPAGTRLRYSRSAVVVQASRKGGDHAVWSADPWLQGILVDVGGERVELPKQSAMALSDIASLVCPEHLTKT